MSKRLTAFSLAFTLLAIALSLVISASAISEEIPVLYVPEVSCFKLEVSLPDSVTSGDTFQATIYVKKTSGSFSSAALETMYGSLCYDRQLFSVKCGLYESERFIAEVSPDGFFVSFYEQYFCDELNDFSLTITVNALYAVGEAYSLDRVYFYTDNVRVYSGDNFYGIGGIGYTEFVFADGDESSDNSSEHFEETFYDRYLDFFDEYALQEDGGCLYGFAEHIAAAEVEEKYPDLLISHTETSATQSGFVSTGDIALYFDDDGNLYKRFKVIVKGDVSKDGQVTAKDYIGIRLHILAKVKLDDLSALAADINDDGKINAADYIAVRCHVLNINNIFS